MRAAIFLLTMFLVLTGQPVGACTIGVFGSGVTGDGRVILWKNRDVSNPDQEMGFFQGPRFRFIANVYAGETLDVWAGINEAGFAIMNSNSYNLSGDGDGADDGNIMHLALGSCATVEDFARLLDSLNLVGRETPANYGVFDASGDAAIFEAGNTFYHRFDADQDTLGFLLRANFSISGGPSRLLGKNRFERAMALCTTWLRHHKFSVEFIIRVLSRDLGQVGFDPYPLPFYGQLVPLPAGYLPIDTTIARATTRSVEIMVGPRPDASSNTGMMWVLLGSPLATLPIPLWVRGGMVPEELNGKNTAIICEEAKRLFNWLCPDPDFPKAVNTFRLVRWLEFIAPREDSIFRLVADSERLWGPAGPDAQSAAELTAAVCQQVIRTYQEFWQKNEPEKSEIILTTTQPERAATFGRLHTGNAVRIYDVTGRRITLPATGIFLLIEDNSRKKFIQLN
ncbi:MAG: carcinine hydrolase/isopenicillin-N N-acyltransferase family protein [candidate division WOR-3 bacterium]